MAVSGGMWYNGKMKILITGAKGMLAQAVREKFKQGNELVLTDSKELDITDAEKVYETIGELRPELVINCAAYTAVDKAEEQEELARRINGDGPGNLARACKEVGATLVHISTDYVFGGGKPVTEEYSEDDEKSPETAYGRTKLEGEKQIVESGCNYYIFRTAWLYGEGPNFVRTMLSLGCSSASADALLTHGTKSTARSATPASLNSTPTESIVKVVNDQHGSPTYAEDLTNIIYQAVTKNIPFGVYNATNTGFTTWAGFTEKIYELAGVQCKVRGISSEEYEKQARARAGDDYKVAPRPKNSKMSKQKLLGVGVEVPDWEDGIKRYLKKELKK